MKLSTGRGKVWQGNSQQTIRKDSFKQGHHFLGDEDGRHDIMQIVSPVLLRKLYSDCLKGTFLGEVKTSIKSSFGSK